MVTAIVVLCGIVLVEAYLIAMLAVWLHLIYKESEELEPIVLDEKEETDGT